MASVGLLQGTCWKQGPHFLPSVSKSSLGKQHNQICVIGLKKERSLVRAETRKHLKPCRPSHIFTVTEHMIGV